MQRRAFRIWSAVILFGVLFALVTVAPVAVGASDVNVSFGSAAGGGRTIVVSGNGFAPGERVTITGFANDSSIVTYPDAAANAIGAFDMTVVYNPSVFRIKAVGQLTGITAFADVGAVSGTPPGFVPPIPRISACDAFDTYYYYTSCPGVYNGLYPGIYNGFYPGYPFAPGGVPIVSGVPVTTAPTGSSTATVGTPVTITAAGFAANETVSATATGPDGKTAQIGSAPASSDGTVTITITFPSAGNWQVAAHGQTSQKDVVNRYTVS